MHLPAEILLSVADSLGDIRDVYSWYAINPRHKAVLGPKLRRSYDGSLLAAEHGDGELLHGCLSTRPELRRRFARYIDHRHDNDLDCQTPLAAAAKHRQIAMIEVAVEAGLLAGHTWAPVYSFKNRDWAVFDSLMSYKDIRADFLSGNAVYMAIDAIKAADDEALQRLLDLPGMSNAYVASAKCPLVEATRCRNRAAMQMLLQRPFVDINARAHRQPTALGAAVEQHDMESIRFLLSDARIDVNLGTPLPLVSAMRHEADLVPLLLQHGADLSRADDDDWTGLLEACRLNHMEMVKSCLEVDPSLRKYVPYSDEPDKYGQLVPKSQPPICIAAEREHFDLVKLLLQYGADPNEVCQSSAFHMPLNNHGGPYYPEIIEYMLPWINDRTMTGDEDDDRMEPLLYATATCSDCPAQRQLVKALIERGADVNCTRFGEPVLIAACEQGLEGIVEILIESGADLNRHGWQESCLEFIEANGSLRLIEIARNAKYS